MNVNLQPGGYLDQLLRQTRWHHVQLSSMADVKANMMLTVSSVIITLAARYVAEPHLRWATLTLMAFCLLTIILAAYAAMPKVSFSSKSPPPDLSDPTFNLLFFGDFIRLTYSEFEAAMEAMLSDPGQAYAAQVREIYTLGTFLARRKYRFVRLAYLAFIAGVIVSAIVLFVETV